MATDVRLILEHLLSFYAFAAKDVISVGAGGGQLAEYGRTARQVIALDYDPGALAALRARLAALGLGNFTLVAGDFAEARAAGDVVLFEFSLHEMPDPAVALARALTMAPEVLVLDHLPHSRWSYYAAEEVKVAAGWQAVRAYPGVRRASYAGEQRFADHAELVAKLSGQGAESLRRAEELRGARDIRIPMPYGLALIRAMPAMA